jgi:alpha,alpha-trehalase
MADTPFTPIRHHDGYPPLEDLGLIGDGSTAALVARDGSIPWMCAPRFDSPPVFAALLDERVGGAFRVALEDAAEARQRYQRGTGILVTEIRGPSGTVRLTDFLALRAGVDLAADRPAGRGELVRMVQVLEGTVRMRVSMDPRGPARLDADAREPVWDLPDRGLRLRLRGSRPLAGPDTLVPMAAGDRLDLALRWADRDPLDDPGADRLRRRTAAAWRQWLRAMTYDGPACEAVTRSALTLKMLDHIPNGSMVAAPTSSLPEAIGGPRNWDYRYAWIRDVAFAVYALRGIGLSSESRSFLEWALDAIGRHGRPHVLYDLDGGKPPPEREDLALEGYRGSAPVRWGNGAFEQRQHDVHGEILDCAWQWHEVGEWFDGGLWERIRRLVESARLAWREPDSGIWEVRSSARPFTYSAAMCQVALDRGARIAERRGLRGDVAGWRADADVIVRAILDEAWDDGVGAITEQLGGGGLDASLLALPLRRVIPADHPLMVATTAAIADRLGAGDGLLYRYLPDVSPDGLPGHEGAFLLCSFWMVDNLTGQGRLDEAGSLFESLVARGGPLGLLPEQIEPGDGSFLGNMPQAFSHVGLISSAVNLARAGVGP